jgi:hypothetical protein
LSSTGAMGLFWFERFYKSFAHLMQQWQLQRCKCSGKHGVMIWQAWRHDLASMAELARFHFPDVQERFCQSMRSTGKCFSSWAQTSLAFSVNCSCVHVQRVLERAHHCDRELMMRCRYWDCCIATRRSQENDIVSSPPFNNWLVVPFAFLSKGFVCTQ